MKISYGVTVCNELEEIQRLIPYLIKHKREEDEIVVQQDELTNPSIDTVAVQNYLNELIFEDKIKFVSCALNNDFASFKNNLTANCSGDYIFQIDADEIPCVSILEILPFLLEQNPDVEVYLVPRVNTVDGLTDEHISKWKWNVNSEGWVNWPDYQWRIYKNTPNIKWKNKVHEILEGFTQYAHLPMEEDYSLYHPKTIKKQEQQNNYYNTL